VHFQSSIFNLQFPLHRGRLAPHVALIAVQVIFGTWPIVGKIVLQTIPSTALVAFRTGGGTFALLILQAFTRGATRIRRSDLLMLALCSGLGIVLNQLLYVKGLSLTTVINTALLGTTIPVFALLASIALGHERPTAAKTIGILVAGAGIIYLIDPAGIDYSRENARGDILIVLNSVAYGAYIAVSKNLLKRYSALTVTTWLFLLGSLITVPVGAFGLASSPLHLSMAVWLALLYIILVPTVGAYYLNSWALQRVEPSTVAVYIYFQPLIAFGLAPVILGESWTLRATVACVLVFAGVAIVTRRGGRGVAEVAKHPEGLGH
jgi:drug/metabolite transporter (DMT)-like permease